LKIYIVCGEKSGDLYASRLVREIRKKEPKAKFRGFGGRNMRNEGVEITRDINNLSFMGVVSVFRNIKSLVNSINLCKNDILLYKPNHVILVDYGGFNLKIARFAKQRNITVSYYIPPKLWAWNKRRIKVIQKNIDNLFVIFPFEVDFYRKYNVKAIYEGNPLIDIIGSIKRKNENSKLITLLPGSREQEVKKILPIMLSVINDFPEYDFTIAGVDSVPESIYFSIIKETDINLVFNDTYSLLSKSSIALITSGTASLESALIETPQIVCYKTNWITYLFAKLLVKTKFISLVNILLDKEVVKELIQDKFNHKNLKKAMQDLMTNHQSNNMINEYKSLKNNLQKKENSFSRVAKEILTN